MATRVQRALPTPSLAYRRVRPIAPNKDPNAAYIAAVAAAVGQCQVKAGGWRRRDLLRGRPNGVASLFALLRELRRTGAAPADVEGVLVALYNAGRALNLEGVAPIANESLADVLMLEQEAEGRENVATVAVLAHPTPGNLRKLRALFIAEMEAQRHAVDVIDAHLMALESGRIQLTNRVRQYLEADEYPAIGPFVSPFTALETLQMDAFRATARLNHWFVVEDRSVPGVVLLSARPLWVKVPNNG